MSDETSLAGLEPLRPGLFRFDEAGEPVDLVGGRCAGCGRITVPARAGCPDCPPGTEIADHVLSRRGVIYAATRIHLPSALGHPPPYAYGYVELPDDGARVFAPLVGAPDHEWTVGEPVELVFIENPATAMKGTLAYGFAAVEHRT